MKEQVIKQKILARSRRESKVDDYHSLSRNEMLGFVPTGAKRILEVGCGEGKFGSVIKQRNQAVVWGVEMEASAAEVAQKNLDKVLIGDIQVEIDRLPKNYFDCVVFNDVLEHLPDPETLLIKIKENIVPGGWIVCSIPNVLYIANLKGMLWDRDWKYVSYGILDRTHLRFFTYKSLKRMFGNLGFYIEQIKGINGCRWKIFILFNLLTLGLFHESKYLQYACVVKTSE